MKDLLCLIDCFALNGINHQLCRGDAHSTSIAHVASFTDSFIMIRDFECNFNNIATHGINSIAATCVGIQTTKMDRVLGSLTNGFTVEVLIVLFQRSLGNKIKCLVSILWKTL